jgi:hypothetical protein
MSAFRTASIRFRRWEDSPTSSGLAVGREAAQADEINTRQNKATISLITDFIFPSFNV